MSQVITTGQITIIDQNDGKPITAILSADAAVQQVFTRSDSASTYVPNFFTTTLTITPKIYIGDYGGVLDLSNNTTVITNRRWSRSIGGTSIYIASTNVFTQDNANFVETNGTTLVPAPFSTDGSRLTLKISGNLLSSVASYPIYFECDYTDPVTSLVTRVVASIELGVVQTGTNAVFVRFRGQTVVESSGTNNKNNIAICADLIRAAGIDRGNLKYSWFDVTGASAVRINQSVADWANKYAISDTAANANVVAVDLANTTDANQFIPTGTNTSDYDAAGTGRGNTLTLSERAISDIAILRCDIEDTVDGKTYTGTVTVFDITDPFEVKIDSSTGEKLLNGQGNSILTPVVYSGATIISPLTNYNFAWTIYDKDGKVSGFVDTGAGGAADGVSWGASIGGAYWNSGNGVTIGTSAFNTSTNVLTHASVGSNFPPSGDWPRVIVKIVVAGVPYFYEVTNMTATTITLKARSSNTRLSNGVGGAWELPALATTLDNGKLFICVPIASATTGVGARRLSTGASPTITVWGQDIEGKARIVCQATGPA